MRNVVVFRLKRRQQHRPNQPHTLKSLSHEDQQVVDDLLAGGRRKEHRIGKLMTDYVQYAHAIKGKLGLSDDQATDAFTDAIMVLVNHVERNIFRGDSKLATYLYRIIYNKGIDLLRKYSTKQASLKYEIPDLVDESADLLKRLEVREDMAQLGQYLTAIGEKCKAILLDWGYWGYSMEEIAQRNELKDARSAKNRKYKCMERLMKLIGDSRSGKSQNP